jgi:hypothetical protein
MTMVKEKPPTAPPPIPLAERKRSPDSSPTKTVILSPESFKTETKNLSLIRLEFTTRKFKTDVNNDPLHKLVQKLVTRLFITDPTLEIYPLVDWPEQYTTVSSTVKTAPETDKHNTNHNEKTHENNKEKSPTITTAATLPADRISFDKYFQYISSEHHPGESKKIVVRMYCAGKKSLSEHKNDSTLDFLFENHMWINASHYDTIRESTIGWLLHVHPDATNRKHYTSQLYDFLNEVVQSDPTCGSSEAAFTTVTPKTKRSKPSESSAPAKTTPTCPPFYLVAKRTGTMRPPTKDKKAEYVQTKVLQIRCETIHAVELQNILSALCDSNQLTDTFIPHSLKETDPSLYLTAIQAQEIFLSNATAIRVDGFSTGGLDLPYETDDTTLRSMIMKSGLFFRIDETVQTARSEGRVLFVTDHARLAQAEEFCDTTLPAYFQKSLTWEQKELLLLPEKAHPIRASNRRTQSATVASYLTKLSSTIPRLVTVEFDSSAQAPPSSKSNTNAWTKKRNPVFFHEKQTRSRPNKTISTSDTSVAESTNTAPTLATQLSHTEALIDSKLAAFRTEITDAFSVKLDAAFERLVAPLMQKFDQVLAQSSLVQAAPPTQQTPMPLNTAVPPLNHHHQHASHDPRYASNAPDNISVHSQSPGRHLPSQGYRYLNHPNTYQQSPPYHIDPQQGHHAPNYDPYDASHQHPEFAAQQQPYYYPPQNHANDYTQHLNAASSSFTANHADLSMAEPQHTMTDPNQSVINHTMTDPNNTTTDQNTTNDPLPVSPRSPPAAPKGILKTTSDKAPSGGASK